MKQSLNKHTWSRLVFLCVVLVALAALSIARPTATSVNIVNNSSRAVVNVYLSHVNANDWSANQLGDATILPSQSLTLNNVSCDQQQVKVIGEDADGCFLSTVVACGASTTWTITNDTAKDCGGN